MRVAPAPPCARGAEATAPVGQGARFSTPERRPLGPALDAAGVASPVKARAPSAERGSELGELVRLLKAGSSDRQGEQRSTIQIRPNVTWPSLGDNDHDVESCIDEYEEVVGLANDGRGMSSKEKLRCFGQCLKASRAKVYKVVLKEAKLQGLLDSGSHAEVYGTVCDRLMEFRESTLERQNRVEIEWTALLKGSRTALQFLPLFEAAVAELELAELGMPNRQLLLG